MTYRGHIIPIPIGHGGLVGTKDQSSITPDKLIVARNISLEGRVLRKEGGAVKYNSSAITGAPSIIAGWDWWPTSAAQRMIALTSAGNLYKDSGDGTFPVTLASGLTVTDAVPVFVEGGKEAAANNRKLFLFTGANAVQVLAADGATTAALATPPADWTGANQPTFGLVHEARLWGGGNTNDPHRLYYSTTASHEDMTGAGSGSLAVYPGEGEKIVGAVSFKGLIVAWKYPRGIYLVDTSNATAANWRVTRLTERVGGVSPRGAVIIDNDILFWSGAGNLHLLSAVQEFGDVASSDITRAGQIYAFIRDNFNMTRLPFIRGVYYDTKKEAHFSFSAAGATVNSARFVVDLNETAPRFRYSDRDTCQDLWLRKDTTTQVPRLTSGDNAGFVWSMDQSTKSKDGSGYSGAWQTPYMDLGWLDPKFSTVRKVGDFLELVAEPTGNWSLTVDIFWDGELQQSVTFNMGNTGAVIGSFLIGTDALGGDQILNKKKRITGSGRRISIAGRNSGAGEDFAIGHLFLHARIGDERLGRDD